MKSAAGQMSRLFCFGENRCRWDAVYFTLTLKVAAYFCLTLTGVGDELTFLE